MIADSSSKITDDLLDSASIFPESIPDPSKQGENQSGIVVDENITNAESEAIEALASSQAAMSHTARAEEKKEESEKAEQAREETMTEEQVSTLLNVEPIVDQIHDKDETRNS